MTGYLANECRGLWKFPKNVQFAVGYGKKPTMNDIVDYVRIQKPVKALMLWLVLSNRPPEGKRNQLSIPLTTGLGFDFSSGS